MQTSEVSLGEGLKTLENKKQSPIVCPCTWEMKFMELASKRQNLENFNQALSSPDYAQISFFFFLLNGSSCIFNQSSNSFKYLDTWLLGDQDSDSVENNLRANL